MPSACQQLPPFAALRKLAVLQRLRRPSSSSFRRARGSRLPPSSSLPPTIRSSSPHLPHFAICWPLLSPHERALNSHGPAHGAAALCRPSTHPHQKQARVPGPYLWRGFQCGTASPSRGLSPFDRASVHLLGARIVTMGHSSSSQSRDEVSAPGYLSAVRFTTLRRLTTSQATVECTPVALSHGCSSLTKPGYSN